MKKIFAMMLALCMMLAAIPVLAETDFTGTWHLNMVGLTCATFELKADGTCEGTSAASTEKKLSGTWTAEENAVTLTIGEQPLGLLFDGTDLKINAEKETDELAALLVFSREAGITIDELNAYSNAGTIPEGKTKEDMEKVRDQMGMLFLIAAFMR